jgi:hypothetical protein
MAFHITAPPVIVQWILGGIGVAALVIALLPPQMIWGQPKITVKFDFLDIEGGRVLRCCVYNLPIVRGILHKMHVTRMPVDHLIADYKVKEQGTNKVVFTGVVPKIVDYTGNYAQRVSLPASAFSVNFGILAINKDGKVNVFDDSNGKYLEPGQYYAEVSIMAGAKSINEKKSFVVVKEVPYAYWCS